MRSKTNKKLLRIWSQIRQLLRNLFSKGIAQKTLKRKMNRSIASLAVVKSRKTTITWKFTLQSRLSKKLNQQRRFYKNKGQRSIVYRRRSPFRIPKYSRLTATTMAWQKLSSPSKASFSRISTSTTSSNSSRYYKIE